MWYTSLHDCSSAGFLTGTLASSSSTFASPTSSWVNSSAFSLSYQETEVGTSATHLLVSDAASIWYSSSHKWLQKSCSISNIVVEVMLRQVEDMLYLIIRDVIPEESSADVTEGLLSVESRNTVWAALASTLFIILVVHVCRSFLNCRWLFDISSHRQRPWTPRFSYFLVCFIIV